jgi:hypothetical protein
VHNTWVLLHDPRGSATAAQVLLLVGGRTDTAARERLYNDVARRLPELLKTLRAAAVQAGLAAPDDPGKQASPFGAESATMPHYDPFSTDADGMDADATAHQQPGDLHPFDPFGEGA